ncbi:MAG: hypothetical protein M5R36_09700 [Deltaproteobacteria bacterium]|nr:hypothetical protein [Deltaproteobacteria bacterium]
MANGDIVKIAAIQQRTSGDWEKDRVRVAERVAFAAEKGAKMAVFPELFGWPWFAADMDKDKFALAETDRGERLAFWRDLAKKIRCRPRRSAFFARRPRPLSRRRRGD